MKEIFFFILFILAIHIGSTFGYFRVFSNIIRASKLQLTEAKVIDEVVLPTFFEEDLYSILGVPQNSTKNEIRTAYMSLVARYHPDRDDSPAAIAIFQNATNAYQILGRDEKKRATYDNKLKAKAYINVLEEVGTEIIKPLAMGVAVPLINLTVQSIGSIARPLIFDAFEQSNAVFLAIEESEEDVRAQTNFFERAGVALERTAFSQRSRKLKSDIDATTQELVETSEKLNETLTKEAEMEIQLMNLKKELNQQQTLMQSFDRATSLAKTILQETLNVENAALGDLRQEELAFTDLESRRTALSKNVEDMSNEIVRLEIALGKARRLVVDMEAELRTVEAFMIGKKIDAQAKQSKYAEAVSVRQEREVMSSSIDAEREVFVTRAKEALKEIESTNATIIRQQQFRGLLEKKTLQLTQRLENLAHALQRIESEHKEREDIRSSSILKRTGKLLSSGLTSMLFSQSTTGSNADLSESEKWKLQKRKRELEKRQSKGRLTTEEVAELDRIRKRRIS